MILKLKRLAPALIGVAALLATGAASGPKSPAGPYFAYVPSVTGGYVFSYGNSRYMATVNSATLQSLGCQEGQRTPSGATALVVLDFGQPAYDTGSGRYGTYLFTNWNFASTGDIASASEAFLNSFYLCSPPGALLRLSVGTSNYRGGTDLVWNWTAHGVAWAQMVNTISAWITAPPSIASKVSVRGGNDFEQWNTYSTPTLARNWIDGYTSAYTGTSYVYNYGACSGCAYYDYPYLTPNYGWSYEDIWYVSYGARPAWPVPEIYWSTGAHADQWYRMSLYGYTQHGQAMNFIGSMTQWQACQERGCYYPNNTPQGGWAQLFNALNADSRTAQTPGWATDITWKNY